MVIEFRFKLYLAFASIHTDPAILKNKSMNSIGSPIFEESQFIIKIISIIGMEAN
jgi:hypothetical protein